MMGGGRCVIGRPRVSFCEAVGWWQVEWRRENRYTCTGEDDNIKYKATWLDAMRFAVALVGGRW